MFKLVIQDDEGKTTVVPLIRDEITIGRKEGNTIRLTERNVSRRHARILRNNGEVHIEDLGSYNGIRVNNARIAERVSLRVSDQVQIGDYKLYLKAEGLEQVDDARTVPIERVDSNTATDVIPAVAPAPTQPMAIPVTPAAMPAAPQLVGNPARTLVAIADTDPNGRPVASAAVVAALTQPAGHGKLVVLSSNFAGKEFELTRPQMIVGRTEDNDIVINHRSISRNHAKLVREPETARYTISDLQSSNGVRVNGQDYGKVELRRGDVVDLGHVRLRFIEPGEDFVFSRDAVITDVPDASSKKGLLVAIVLGLIVLAGVTIFFLTREPSNGGNKDPEKPGSGSPSGNVVQPNQIDAAGSAEVVIDAADTVATNNNPPDAVEQVTTIDAAPIDTTDTKLTEALASANKALADKRWADVIEDLDRLGGPAAANPEVKRLRAQAAAEQVARAEADKVADNTKDNNVNLRAAETALRKIPESSVYHKPAEDAFRAGQRKELALQTSRARALAARTDECAAYKKLMGDIVESDGRDFMLLVQQREPCKTATKPPVGDGSAGSGSQGGGSATTVKPPKNGCENLADTVKSGKDAYAKSNWGEAQKYFEKALSCGDGSVVPLLFAAVCQLRDEARAKSLYRTMSPELQVKVSQICTRNGVNLDK